jgi:hypothetical protein
MAGGCRARGKKTERDEHDFDALNQVIYIRSFCWTKLGVGFSAGSFDLEY